MVNRKKEEKKILKESINKLSEDIGGMVKGFLEIYSKIDVGQTATMDITNTGRQYVVVRTK